MGSWGRFGRKEGEFDRPSGLAFNAQGDLYVADSMNHRVQKFTKDGRFLGMWGGYGIEFGQFDMPWGLSVDH